MSPETRKTGRFNIAEAARRLNVSERRVRALAKDRGIERPGRDWWFTAGDIKLMRPRKSGPAGHARRQARSG